MKKYLVFFAVVFVAVTLVLIVVFSNLGMIVKHGIETHGSAIMGTEVAVDKVDLQPRAGKAIVTGLTIANPGGYAQTHAFELQEITADINFETETVREILIKQPVINIEVIAGNSNIQHLADHIKTYKGDQSEQSSGQEGSEPIIMNIELLRIESAKATMVTDFSDKTYQFKIDQMELHNLRGTREQVAKQISQELIEHVAQEVAIEILKEKARSKASELGDKLKDLING